MLIIYIFSLSNSCYQSNSLLASVYLKIMITCICHHLSGYPSASWKSSGCNLYLSYGSSGSCFGVLRISWLRGLIISITFQPLILSLYNWLVLCLTHLRLFSCLGCWKDRASITQIFGLLPLELIRFYSQDSRVNKFLFFHISCSFTLWFSLAWSPLVSCTFFSKF